MVSAQCTNENMDEKLGFTGPDSFPRVLMWPYYKYSYYCYLTVHLTFECKFNSELAAFSPEGTIFNARKYSNKRKPLQRNFPPVGRINPYSTR